MSRKTPKGRIVARFSEVELAPSTGSPVEDFSFEMARSTAAKVAAFDGIYLQHDAHRRAFGSFDYLRELNRAPGPKRAMRLIGPSSAGKSTAIEQYERIVSRRGGYGDGRLPVISIKLDRACTTKRLVTSVLDRYGDEYSNSSNESTLRARAYMCIRRFGTELIFVDEVQHLAFRSSERSDPTDALKRMLDDGVVSLVFAGDPSALPLMMRNIQLANRMITPCDMRPLDFRNAEDRSVFRSFVRRLDAAMVESGVTARTSGLDEPRTLHCLSVVSSGLIGRVVNLVRIALEISSRRGADLVEIHDLSQATRNWAIPQLITRYDPFSSGVVDE